MTDFSHTRYFVAFIGSARSGTTLVRSLLDAHPNAVIGNEVNVLSQLKNGKSWRGVLNRIVENSKSFQANPVHTGYDYNVPIDASPGDTAIEIIGDKKAGVSTVFFRENPRLLAQFLDWVEVPVRFIHCVRHPLDVIATKKRRLEERGENKLLTEIVSTHFELHKTVVEIFKTLDSNQWLRLYQEEVVMAPISVLTDLLQFLGLKHDEDYLKACESVVNSALHLSRHSIEWAPRDIDSIEEEVLKYDHLHRYLDGGRLLYKPRTED